MTAKRKSIPKLDLEELLQVKPIQTYGLKPGFPQILYDRKAFVEFFPIERTGISRGKMLKRIADAFTPDYFEWHPWTWKMVDTLCANRWVGMTGCSSSTKTHNVAGFAVNWWLARPEVSSVMFCSTTKGMLRKRGWAEVQDCYSRFPEPKFGNFVDSQMIWQAKQGDSKHGVFGKAVEEGATQKVMNDIIGHHTVRQMIVIDEGPGVREAIYDAASNLWSYPAQNGEFIMVVLGNLISWMCPMGKFCRPLHGPSSVSVEDDEWETYVQLDGKTGICIHFDALKSPNIIEERLVSRHLPRKENVESAIKKAGSEHDPLFWANWRGFPPPEGTLITIFTEPGLINGGAFDKPEPFVGGDLQVFGGFDPAYTAGGDKAAVRFCRCGEIVKGGKILALEAPMRVNISVESPEKRTFQLARGARELCEKFGCPPEHLAVDDSNSPGLCDVMQREWGEVIRVIGAGKASDQRTVSHEDNRICYEVYRNKVSEMWFGAKEFVDAGQVRGLDASTAQGLVGRCYTGGVSSQKLQVEDKRVYKARLGHSPDDEDALALMFEAARRNGIQIRKVGRTIEPDRKFKAQSKAYEELYETADYTQPEEEPDDEIF